MFILQTLNKDCKSQNANLLPGWPSACPGLPTGSSEPGSQRWLDSTSGPGLGSPTSRKGRTILKFWFWWYFKVQELTYLEYNRIIQIKTFVQTLTLRAFSRYILYLSSMARMSSSFFFRAAMSSSTFKAERHGIHLRFHWSHIVLLCFGALQLLQ